MWEEIEEANVSWVNLEPECMFKYELAVKGKGQPYKRVRLILNQSLAYHMQWRQYQSFLVRWGTGEHRGLIQFAPNESSIESKRYAIRSTGQANLITTALPDWLTDDFIPSEYEYPCTFEVEMGATPEAPRTLTVRMPDDWEELPAVLPGKGMVFPHFQSSMKLSPDQKLRNDTPKPVPVAKATLPKLSQAPVVNQDTVTIDGRSYALRLTIDGARKEYVSVSGETCTKLDSAVLKFRVGDQTLSEHELLILVNRARRNRGIPEATYL